MKNPLIITIGREYGSGGSEIGIELTVKASDDNTVKQTYQEGNFQLIANGHGSFGGDPKYLAVLATNTAGAAKITVGRARSMTPPSLLL